MIGAYFAPLVSFRRGHARRLPAQPGAQLQEGWVLANHILVSFHAAFLSSVLALPNTEVSRGEVLEFVFVSWETLISVVFLYITFHVAVASHELGHFLTAARLNALNESIAGEVRDGLSRRGWERWSYLARAFVLAPWGRATGVKREGLNYYPDAPYNLAVAAAGPRVSRNVACFTLLPAAALLSVGLLAPSTIAVYVGRLLLGIGIVTALDFLIADRGKYREFKERERKAEQAAAGLAPAEGWLARAPEAKQRLIDRRMQEILHPRLGPVQAPWQFRNCGMGGRHTEKEYPESNISMQEAMFLILGARDYLDAQEMTVALQARLKEIIENAEGGRVMGIGLEGGLAPYIDPGAYPMPEVRLWVMMKQAIEECGYRPGEDVAIALDPAMSELEIAYREEFGVPDSVGMYLFWRDERNTVLDRDGVLALFERAVREFDVPILVIEDGFSEDDHEGWKKLNDEQGERLLIVGDDLVTTNDATIEDAADRGLVNSALIKANQIGTLHETLLAMLVALGKGLTLVVSHRSKSPNDDMEAHIALATNALGLKAGGGANTERLIKYHSVATQLARLERGGTGGRPIGGAATVEDISASEEPTNAGVPTVGVDLRIRVFDGEASLVFHGATPLGTSAGTGEAVHLVDKSFAGTEHAETVVAHRALLDEVEAGGFTFRSDVTPAQIQEIADDHLSELFARTRRYQGKGCLNAIDNVRQVIAPYFGGRDLAAASFLDLDRALLQLERSTAERRKRLAPDAASDEAVAVMQRKANLGMNAVLSVSLALARAIAYVRGLELWELLREEMVGIIERLANAHGVPIEGSRFEDYVAALRQVSDELTRQGVPLHTELRQLTQVYDDPQLAPPSSLPLPRPSEQRVDTAAGLQAVRPTPRVDTRETDEPRSSAQMALSDTQQQGLREVSLELQRSVVLGDDAARRREVLRHYIRFRTDTWKTVRPFEIVNDRIIADGERLVVPYLVGDDLVVHSVRGDEVTIERRTIKPGTIFTDARLAEIIGIHGDVIDLEDDLYGHEVETLPGVRVTRIRDMVTLLRELENSPNYYRAAVYLRTLVVRLCGKSFAGFLGAKNLRPEVKQLDTEIVKVLNGPFADRLKLSMRVLVRHVSALLLRPNLIDPIWSDTIDLAEIHIRGSRIANELRRSSHHALGSQTLALASAYHSYLESGSVEALAELGFDSVSEADEAARRRTVARNLVERILGNLEKLLGRSEIVDRIHDWQDGYSEALARCEFGTSLDEELDAIVSGGIQARNCWVFRHHMRILGRKTEEVAVLLPDSELERELRALEQLDPAADDFDAEGTEQTLRDAVARLDGALRARCLDSMFTELDDVLDAYTRGAFLKTVRAAAQLRGQLETLIDEGGFREQRYLLYQLDCLLEEMGYLSVRHIASSYEARGVLLDECFEMVQISAQNLVHGGLRSEELCDLTAMLRTTGRSDAELLNILDALRNCYHRVVQRNSLSFEALGQRLELSSDDLRIVLANLQRYLHDLNSIAYLSDLAKSHVLACIEDDSGPASERAEAHEPARFDILHLSHRDEIERYLADPNALLREHYGSKGSGLIRISHAGIPTRDGFILPTDLGRSGINESDGERLAEEIHAHLEILERDIERREGGLLRFGDRHHPLLLAVRGGSVFSMPGILRTVVFVGINDEIAESLAAEDPWYAYDSYRRFLTSWGGAVLGVDLEHFDLVEAAKRQHGVRFKNDLPWEAMRDVVENCKEILREQGSATLLDEALSDPNRQIISAVHAVVSGWNTDRARRYREITGLADSWNTAVIIQHMASGNRRNADVREGMDETRTSLTGVIPHTQVTRLGMRQLTGDIKFSASGDDLVGGLTAADSFEPIERLRSLTPMLERRIDHIGTRIRMWQGTDVELEFTVDRGVLSILQARMATTAREEGICSFDEPGEPVGSGVGIRGGAFRGRAAFNEADVAELDGVQGDGADGVLVVLENPTPEEIPLILTARGLLAARGGSTSHAAVAVHGIQDRPFSAVLGATGLRVDDAAHCATLVDADGHEVARIQKGDVVSIDGRTGSVWLGSHALLKAPQDDPET